MFVLCLIHVQSLFDQCLIVKNIIHIIVLDVQGSAKHIARQTPLRNGNIDLIDKVFSKDLTFYNRLVLSIDRLLT